MLITIQLYIFAYVDFNYSVSLNGHFLKICFSFIYTDINTVLFPSIFSEGFYRVDCLYIIHLIYITFYTKILFLFVFVNKYFEHVLSNVHIFCSGNTYVIMPHVHMYT